MLRTSFYTIFSIPVFAMLYLYTGTIVIIILVLAFLEMKGSVRQMTHFWAKSVFYILFKVLRIEGLEHVEPEKKYILLANHASLFDIMAIMAFYPNVSWFGREHLLKVPLFGQILKMLDYVPMRKATTVKSTKTMLNQLVEKARGLTIAIFPEGTRTLDGKINRFHRGFIYLTRTTGLDILPVTLNGFFMLKPKNRFHINFSSQINVIIHQPIANVELIDKSDEEIIAIVKTVIESEYNQRDLI